MAAPHLKLALGRTDLLGTASMPSPWSARAADLADVHLLPTAYPGTWFGARMLATGRYVGIREDGRLVCVAGVHVHSPTWRRGGARQCGDAAGTRGQGLAQAACAALCRLLLADGIETIALNVRADNEPRRSPPTRGSGSSSPPPTSRRASSRRSRFSTEPSRESLRARSPAVCRRRRRPDHPRRD